MTETRFAAVLAPYERRFRTAAVSRALILAASGAGALVALSLLAGAPQHVTRTSGIVSFVVVLVAAGGMAWRGWTTIKAAERIEAQLPGAQNIVITAAEVSCGRTAARHAAIRGELFRAAEEVLDAAPPQAVQPLGRVLALGAGCVAALLAILVAVPVNPAAATSSATVAGATMPALTPGDLRVIVTPPEYARGDVVEAMNPERVVALEGSRVRLETASGDGSVVLVDAEATQTPFARKADKAWLEFVATRSRPLVIRRAMSGAQTVDRLLHVEVVPDNRPLVRIREPARDLVFSTPDAQVPVVIEARDDIGLAMLGLRYTRVAGLGENFTFEEGEWPLTIERTAAGQWNARAVFMLDSLQLQDGDTLVYRAVARDAKPDADPSSSETFLIEIGRLSGIASAGFALPDDRDGQGISQQMLIIKTERLEAEKSQLSPEAYAEQSRLLAIEQRMVKAEFVFMTGGEVEDEIEEAAHSHELAEGRLANAAQVELLTAIREMSRAEAQLNDADTAQALVFERAALRALQRAFDRRRYLLRTLPERTRIDLSRRLTGELEAARSSLVPPGDQAGDPTLAEARTLIRELSGVNDRPADVSMLGSRLIALQPSSVALQAAALRLSTASDADTRVAAIREAQRVLLELMRRRVPRGSQRLTRDSMEGLLADELTRRGSP